MKCKLNNLRVIAILFFLAFVLFSFAKTSSLSSLNSKDSIEKLMDRNGEEQDSLNGINSGDKNKGLSNKKSPDSYDYSQIFMFVFLVVGGILVVKKYS